MFRTAIVFAATSFLGVALACGGKCPMATAEAGDRAKVDITQASGDKVELALTGLDCGACAEKVQKKLLGVDGVTAASVDVEAGKAHIAFDASMTDTAKLIAAVSESGPYTATKLESKVN